MGNLGVSMKVEKVEMFNPPVQTEKGVVLTINPRWTKAFIARLLAR